jgi:hypothetical protein
MNRRAAIALTKIANDIRWLASGLPQSESVRCAPAEMPDRGWKRESLRWSSITFVMAGRNAA